jgi:hypothetical protein
MCMEEYPLGEIFGMVMYSKCPKNSSERAAEAALPAYYSRTLLNPRSANALLRASVEIWTWKEISETAAENPHRAFAAIGANNKVPDDIWIDQSLAKLDNIKLTNTTAIRSLLLEFEEIHTDIHEAKGTYTYAQLIATINTTLLTMPREYNDFVQHWKLTHYNATMNKDIFKQFRTLLLHYADENKVHWLTAPKALFRCVNSAYAGRIEGLN